MAYAVAVGFVLAFVTLAHAQNPSPCPAVVSYDKTLKSEGKWQGTLTFDSEFELSGMWIRVILDKKAEKLENDLGEVFTDDNISFLIKMPHTSLTPGHPVKVPFKVHYSGADVPSVVTVRLNARDICPKKKDLVSISPCPGSFKYTQPEKSVQGKWHGELLLDSEFELHGIWIRVNLDRKAEVIQDGFGEVVTRENNGYLIRDKNHNLVPGTPLKVPFVVKYDQNQPIPNIVSIRLNGRTICQSRHLQGPKLNEEVSNDTKKPLSSTGPVKTH